LRIWYEPVSDVVIRAEGLGKRYLIGHQSAERERYTALRDVVGRSLKGLGRSALEMMRGRQIVAGDEVEEFWALKDVSFEIKRGEVVGIIGRNGAGKSTLLKILSRITEPSIGRVEIKGRVASLLEVGTGFHPELTGRENIYLNGAILGMTQAEIKRQFDQIVAFAEVEKFLDTPVKRYSSGMYVRLAFAVAAHLQPEILIVDEVLAVGDAEFQRKCLGKMQEVAEHGRTVVFVSHQLDIIAKLCRSTILMNSGRVEVIGATESTLHHYRQIGSVDLGLKQARLGRQTVTAALLGATFSPSTRLNIKVLTCIEPPSKPNDLCLLFYSQAGTRIAIVDLRLAEGFDVLASSATNVFQINLIDFWLVSGSYRLTLWARTQHGEKEIEIGSIEVPVLDGTKEPLSLYPDSLNGIVKTFGRVELQKSTKDNKVHNGT
jgi:ABC-type polysaccharide/polyol phosphate transport system ATPase subunit